MIRKTAVSTVHWIFQTNHTVSEARKLVSNLARNKNLKPSILALCLVLSAVVEQTRGQSTCRDAVSFPGLSDWGIDSLYHMERGIRGAASCATSSCHGGPRAGVSSADAPRGSEYPLWLESDPHAQSWKNPFFRRFSPNPNEAQHSSRWKDREHCGLSKLPRMSQYRPKNRHR